MSEKLPILAIETSGSLCSACVYYDDNEFYESNIHLKNSHAEKIFEVIDSVMNSAGVNLNQLDAIAVSSGPGSFTGLRIGMSAVKGIAFGASLPVIAVPTFEALSMQIAQFLPDKSEFVIANKVNIKELYFAKFQIRSNNFIFVEDLQLIEKNELDEKTANALKFGNAFSGDDQLVLSAPSAKYVAMWADKFGKKITDYDYLEPDYLKNFIVRKSNG